METQSWIPDFQYQVMRWIGEMRGVDYLLLRYLLGRNNPSPDVKNGILAPQTTTDKIKKWVKHGLVNKEKLCDGHTWVWLTRKGLYETGLTYEARRPSARFLDHTRGLTRIRYHLECKYGVTRFISEREIDSQWKKLPKAQQEGKKKADLIFWLNERPTALEYERSEMTRDDIINLYNQYTGAWLVGTDATVPKLKKLIEGYENYFEVGHESKFTLEP